MLRSLTPAEQLAGYDEAIRNLGAKLDLILRANDDPSTVQQLEGAIAALRSIVSNVASNDALARLADDVHTLSSKVDQLARADDHGDSFAVLEQRIAALTSTLESRERPAASDNSEHLEGALRALSDRIDRMQVGNDSASAFAHLEQRVSYLLERLEASSGPALRQSRPGRGRAAGHSAPSRTPARQPCRARREQPQISAPAPTPIDSGLVDLVKRELSDIRFSQTETDRHTQDSLETVHNTLGHVVDRLAMIEGDLRAVRSAPIAPAQPGPDAGRTAGGGAARRDAAGDGAAAETRIAQSRGPSGFQRALQEPPQAHFAAAPREFHAAQPPAAPAPPLPPRAISEILEPHAAPPRAAIEPELPPDHPLEPGTRPTARLSSPSERIAASESAISEISTGPKKPVSTSSFIAAARRAAQAAAAQPVNEKAARAASKAAAKAKAGDKPNDGQEPSTITSKIRSLLVGASVVVIVLGTFKMAMTLLDSGSPPPMPAMENSSEPAASAAPMPAPADNAAGARRPQRPR